MSPSPTSMLRAPGVAAGLQALGGARTVLQAVHGADDRARQLSVAASARPDHVDGHAIQLPDGVWPRDDSATPATADPALTPALASYAALLRARKAPAKASLPRGLPIVLRRRGATASGALRGPGGLARSCVPEDHPNPVIDQVRERRPPRTTSTSMRAADA